MLIVVEGAPLTGKTTLARALALDIIDEGRDAEDWSQTRSPRTEGCAAQMTSQIR